MIQSMTGYAAGTRDLGSAILNIELKSVNSRYLDLGFRMSEDLRTLEMPIRELLSAKLSRGKIECRAYLQSQHSTQGNADDATPNAAVIARLVQLQAGVLNALPSAAPLSVNEILRWPGVLAEDSLAADTLQRESLALVTALLDELLATRTREGDKLVAVLREISARMRAWVAQAAPLMPQALADYQDRLSAKLREAVANLDEDRIRQEVGVFAAKIDVAEELARLNTHLDELERVLKKGGAVGKRLDFLMQELNREANTLASKSVSAEITVIALDLKLAIEQMREQVQNLE
ncbi:MAG: YicC family protein [Rhodocyclaceae bacterium]|nr:YicC family protein [Rhodocyclaceae bacterium]